MRQAENLAGGLIGFFFLSPSVFSIACVDLYRACRDRTRTQWPPSSSQGRPQSADYTIYVLLATMQSASAWQADPRVTYCTMECTVSGHKVVSHQRGLRNGSRGLEPESSRGISLCHRFLFPREQSVGALEQSQEAGRVAWHDILVPGELGFPCPPWQGGRPARVLQSFSSDPRERIRVAGHGTRSHLG